MNADGIARVYRWLEYAAFGFALEHARFDFLSRAADARRVLILGEGDGRFLARLLAVNRHATVTVVESSAGMIELARQRVAAGDRERVELHQTDASEHPLPEGPFDLIVTHFFLDVFSDREAEALVCKVDAVSTPGALWLINEFQEPPRAWRRLHARAWLRTMYAFFWLATGLRTSRLPDYRKMLTQHGFVEAEYRERRFGLIRSQVWRK